MYIIHGIVSPIISYYFDTSMEGAFQKIQLASSMPEVPYKMQFQFQTPQFFSLTNLDSGRYFLYSKQVIDL